MRGMHLICTLESRLDLHFTRLQLAIGKEQRTKDASCCNATSNGISGVGRPCHPRTRLSMSCATNIVFTADKLSLWEGGLHIPSASFYISR